MKKILFIFGTRPEAIKLAPLIKTFQHFPSKFDVKLCITAQHRKMLDQVLDFFEIKPHYDLNLMKQNQKLFDITANALIGLRQVLSDFKSDAIFVQGDTTTAFVGALAGFYTKSNVIHVEAGLRSGNKLSPFPEEINRTLIGHLTDIHFAPTNKAKENLKNEGITQNVFVVGNTVIDALFLGLEMIKKNDEKYKSFFDFVDFSKRILLVTGHRRESFGKPLEDICFALQEIALRYDDVEIIYPVHLNPNIREPVNRILTDIKNIHLTEPLAYPYLIWLLSNSYFILTDSGGIQEEAPSLGKPVLVMRDVTERIEGIMAGTAKLVGTEKEKIVNLTSNLLDNHEEYEKMVTAVNPYGDGKSSNKILEIFRSL